MTLDRAKIRRILRFTSSRGWGKGIKAHRVMDRVMASIGAKIKRVGEEDEGRKGSLINSLTPSAIGWRRP